jgi:hypothetical protein
MRKKITNYVHFIHLLFKVRRTKPDVDCLALLFVLGNGLLDMSSNLEWANIEQRIKHVQAGKN